MKPTAFSVLALLSLLASASPAQQTLAAGGMAEPDLDDAYVYRSYLVSGLNPAAPESSGRFYDSGKGHYYGHGWYTLKEQAHQLYNETGSFDFLGSMKNYLTTTTWNDNALQPLTYDGNTCWYQTVANMLQYWESYYGVFCNSSKLPYGYTYDRKYHERLGGTQSLNITKFFYDRINNVGGFFPQLINWYLAGTFDSNNYMKAFLKNPNSTQALAGFYGDYFSGAAAGYVNFGTGRNDSATLAQIQQSLTTGLGMVTLSDGTVAEYIPGQIVYLALHGGPYNGAYTGHAITCYGYGVDSSNRLACVYVVNSDDLEYKLLTLYVKNERDKEGGSGYHNYLYTDPACTQLWTYASRPWWFIDQLCCINTPPKLQQMAKLYYNPTAPLLWNGKATNRVLTANTNADMSRKTTAAAGWDVYLNSTYGYYPSFFRENVSLRFTDYSKDGTVYISGNPTSSSMQFRNSKTAYTVSPYAGKNPLVTTGHLYKDGTKSAILSGLRLNAKKTTLDGGTLSLRNDVLTGTSMSLKSGKLQLVDSSLTLSGDLDTVVRIQLAGENSISVNRLYLQQGADLQFVLTPANRTEVPLTFTGGITTVPINFDVVPNGLIEDDVYRLIKVSNLSANALDYFNCPAGDLAYSGGYVTMTYKGIPWGAYTGKWNAGSWAGDTKDNREGCTATFYNEGTKVQTVTVTGAVNPKAIRVKGGKYIFAAGTGAAVTGSGPVTVSGKSVLDTRVSLSNHPVTLNGKGQLIYRVGKGQNIPMLTMTSGSRLVAADTSKSARISFAVRDADVLQGRIDLVAQNGYGPKFQFLSADDQVVGGTLTSDAKSNFFFRNGSSYRPVTYDLKAATSAVKSLIYVGSASDAAGTTLRLSAPSANTFALAANGRLLLDGAFTFTGAVKDAGNGGYGVVEIPAGSVISVTHGHSSGMNEALTLQVDGTAAFGGKATALTTGLAKKVAVTGTLNVVQDPTVGASASKKINFALPSLTLSNGGVYNWKNYLASPQRWTTSSATDCLQTIGTLTVGSGGGTVNRWLASDHKNNPYIIGSTTIKKLKGSGDLTLAAKSVKNQLTLFRIASAADYTGNLTIANRSTATESSIIHANAAVAELGAMTLPGSVTVDASAGSAYSRAALGIDGDVTLHGLTGIGGSSKTFLYSGRFTGREIKTGNLLNYVTPAAHTLTIDTAGKTFSFEGTVGKSLNIVKEGTGTQRFLGNMKSFNGSVAVNKGTLETTSALNMKKLNMQSGTTLAGAGSKTAATANLNGATLRTDGSVTLTKANFSGKNTIQAGHVNGDSWVFTLTSGSTTPILTLNGTGLDSDWSLGTVNVDFGSGSVAGGKYVLCAWDDNMDLTGGIRAGSSIDASNLYQSSLTLSGKHYTTLVYNYSPTRSLMAAPQLTEAAEEEPLALAEPDCVGAAESPAEQASAEQEPAALTAAAEPAAADPAYARARALRPLGDALVQADWAAVDALRSFTGSIRDHSAATVTADGQGAVWASALLQESRRGSSAGHAGAVSTLSGGAVGVEHTAGSSSLVGLAVGSSVGRIGQGGISRLRSSNAHVAAYGQHALGKSWSAEWSAAWGRTANRGDMGGTRAHWNQQSAELNARLQAACLHTDSFALRAFAGLQYDATDSATALNVSTGSVQNLRAEAGVNGTCEFGSALFFAEVGAVGDAVRRDPTVDFGGGLRQQGAKTGRFGVKASAGCGWAVNEHWSLQGAYSIEAAKHATFHNVNIGVSRSF